METRERVRAQARPPARGSRDPAGGSLLHAARAAGAASRAAGPPRYNPDLRTPRIPSRLGTLLLLGVSSLLALALAEGLLRRLAPQPLDAAYVWPDGTLRHVPSFRFVYSRQEFSNLVSYNSLGLRGPDVATAPPRGTLRLVFLGDSFVEGKQVGDEEVITARLARAAASRGRPVEVVNAGVGGYGTGDELLLWERALEALRPDVVLVGFFANDVRNNVDRPFFDVRDGRVVQVEEPPRPRVRWLYECQKFLVSRSHLAYLVKGALAGGDQQQALRGALAEDEDAFAVNPSPRTERGWAMTLALLSELRRRVEAAGARFAVVVFPTRYQVSDALWAAQARRLGLDPAGFDLRTPQRRLGEWAQGSGTELIDLLDAFRGAAPRGGLYFSIDAHWTAAGHALAADTLCESLLGRGLLSAAPGR
jgi:hypothetical protein